MTKRRRVLPLRVRLEALRSQLAEAAQQVYDEWEQDENGECEWRGTGGICDDIADGLGDVLTKHRIDWVPAGSEGADHAWVVAYDDAHAYDVDIPPYVYERGGGYCWRKIPDVTIGKDDVLINPMDRSLAQQLIDYENR